MSASTARLALLRTVFAAQVRERPLRLVVTVLAIALGVALAAGVFLVNATALDEFARATRQLVGEADVVVRGPRAGFDERLYGELARRPEVRVASPVLELEAALARGGTLKIVGVDPFQAGAIQPAIYGELVGSFFDLLEPDAIALSASAARELGLAKGGVLEVGVGSGTRSLRVVAVLSEAAYPQRLGIMDIGSAQWTLARVGMLNRIDVRLAPGVDVAAFREAASSRLPPGVLAVTPEVERDRAASLTRAYRVNLNMLALVALLTGAFLVFATQALAVLRRRTQLALLRALGVTRGQLQGVLLAEGALVGLAGGVLGSALGWLLAAAVLRRLGGDLGAGMFDATAVAVRPSVGTLLAFVAIGVAVAIAGAWAPARQAARMSPARALKAGDDEPLVAASRATPAGIVLLLAGAGAAFLPPAMGLPIFGYVAVALLLFGGVLLVPLFATALLALIPAHGAPQWSLAIAQLRGTVSQSTVSLAAIVVSFSLMVAMAIMVHSFRDSFERWLGDVLPADLNLRIAYGNDTAYFGPDEQAAMARIDGVERVEFHRLQQLYLDPERAPVTLIARPIAHEDPGATLPMLATAVDADPRARAYVSEAMADLYGARVGAELVLPVAGREQRVRVAGLWRDYARSHGAVVVDLATYRAWTGDPTVTEAALWLAPGADAARVEAAIREGFAQDRELQVYATPALRELSLRIFDRAFAITYALEAIAVAIGLVGVSFAFGSQALARRAEFGMLRHVGMLRRDVLRMLAGEGALLGALGTAYGLLLGGVLSLVLVYVINRQSFHWSLDFAVPGTQLALVSLALVIAASATAVASARAATSPQAVRAVREDW